MTRCIYCRRRIWPWSHYGFRVLSESFFVPGVPAPKGSWRRGRHGQIFPASPHLQAWEAAVAKAAAEWVATREWEPGTPLMVTLDFYLARPATHHRPDGTLAAAAVMAWPKAPDLDKLCRSTLDALKAGHLLEDDAQVVELHASKRYGPKGGCAVGVWPVVP